MKSIHRGLSAACFAVALTLPGFAVADNYPTQPIRIINPYSPGGGVDTTLRIVAERLQQELGQPIVIENRTGGLGVIAMNATMGAPADGYTFMAGNQTTNVITPLFHPDRIGFDYFEAFTPVMRLTEFPAVVMVTTNNFAPTTLAEVIDYARENPGRLRYTSTGVASFPHFDTEMIAAIEDLEMLHVPVSDGAAGIAQSIMNGDAQLAVNNVVTSLPVIQSGHARAVAVIAPERLSILPDVPTLAELGFEGIGTIQWIGIFGRSEIPEERLERFVEALNVALADEAVIESFARQMVSVTPFPTLAEVRQWHQDDIANWQETIAVTGISAE